MKKPWYSFNKDTDQKRKIFPEIKDLGNHEKKDALHVACEIGHHNVVRILLEGGIEANNETSSGKNSLHLAVNESQKDCVQKILKYYQENEQNQDKTTEPRKSKNFFSKKRETDDEKVVKKNNEILFDILNSRDKELDTPIMLAIKKTKYFKEKQYEENDPAGTNVDTTDTEKSLLISELTFPVNCNF